MNIDHFIAFLSVVGLAIAVPEPVKISPKETTSVLAQPAAISVDNKGPPDNTTTTSTTSTTTSTTTIRTTPPPDTTTSSTTTSAPNTTTSSTTTSAPNTTTSSTTTTPTTTTPIVTSTTPAPNPEPKPASWYVLDGNNTCISAKMILKLNVTYPTTNGTNVLELSVSDGNPNGTNSTGFCGISSQNMTINLNDGHNLTLSFVNNTEKQNFVLSAITLYINASALKNLNTTGNPNVLIYKENATLFPTPLQMSYKCDRLQNLTLTIVNGTTANVTAALSMEKVQIQAFRNAITDPTKYGDTYDCNAMDTPDVVPIAVGCALIALVLIVLAAYLISRRRTQSRGYMSID